MVKTRCGYRASEVSIGICVVPSTGQWFHGHMVSSADCEVLLADCEVLLADCEFHCQIARIHWQLTRLHAICKFPLAGMWFSGQIMWFYRYCTFWTSICELCGSIYKLCGSIGRFCSSIDGLCGPTSRNRGVFFSRLSGSICNFKGSLYSFLPQVPLSSSSKFPNFSLKLQLVS